MTIYHYVSDAIPGTNVGDTAYATPRTDAFGSGDLVAANVYASITTCIANASLVDGNYIMVDAAHSEASGTNHTYNFTADVTIVSVTSADASIYGSGAKEEATDTGTALDINISSTANEISVYHGMELGADDSIVLVGAGTRAEFHDCVIHIIGAGTGGKIYAQGDGCWMYFKDTEINFSNASQSFDVDEATVIMDGVTSTGTALTSQLFVIPASSGGPKLIHIKNTRLDQLMATNAELCNQLAATAEGVHIKVERSKLNSGFGVFTTTPVASNYIIEITECHTSSGYHYFYYADYRGVVEENTTTFLNATYDGSTGFSAKATSSSVASPFSPLRYKFGSFPAQDLTTAKTVTIECSSDLSLTNNDIWVEIEHNTTVNEALGTVITTQVTDKVGAGAGLTNTGTGTWTSGDTEDYIITKDIGAITDVDNANVNVYICVGKPSIDVYFDLPTIAAT